MSLQDDLFDILEINTEENKESAISQSQSTTATTTTTSSSKAAFDVFLDELLNIPMTSQPIYKPVVTPISTPEEQEEEMWGEFDDDAFFNLSDCSSSNEENKKQKESLDLTLFGFKTASGKELKPVSEEATRRARALLNEEPLDNFPMSNSNPTPANDDSSINSNSPPANNDELLLAKNDPPVTFSGFKTASGKQLKPISKEAVEKAKALLLEESTNEKARVNTMFTTASGKSLTASKEEATKWGATLLKEPKEGTKRDRENEPKKKRGLQDISNVNTMAKRYKQSTLQKVKPFKSPIIRSNIELTKAAIGNRNIQQTRGLPVFDLKVPSNRRKLSSLGKPQQYTRQQLLSKNIPYDIIDMTSSTSRKYIFNGTWGIKQAHKELIDAGALPNRLSLAWVENHYGLIVWKLACQVRSYPDVFLKDWKPEIILRQLLYRYEREINQGHRPVLKKILEQDDIAAKHMILAVSDIIEINAPVFYNTCGVWGP
ncbi:hypothetical protein G6F64_009897 [Rhizopus arrhizus]|uniref:Breast cancer type 2 susceptibility protein helical domain-containing protein n=1 Tax=Rhizopus oryzae TaxID=64495 RepID=A0A9P6X290_RHIOR|nr:hypothetical protein G6F64_009897 [Rhizopus arrhizus]